MEPFYIVTGRYDNETWEASVAYRARKQLACIYAPPCRISDKVPPGAPTFVIEMNNSLNEIMGIGLMFNKLVTDKVYKVQADSNCNRYIYIGQHHLTREQLVAYNPFFVYVLVEILFKGYTHSKRGTGLTRLPEKVLALDVCEGLDVKKEIRNVFIHHFREKEKENKK